MKIRISTKLFTGFTLILLLMVVVTYWSLTVSQGYLKAAAGKNFVFLAEETLMWINQSIYRRIEELQLHAKHLMLHDALSASNREYEKLSDIESFLHKRDKEWRSVPKEKITPFMRKLIDNVFSKNLRNDFIDFYENKYGYKLYHEIFVTNKYGANVAMSGKTSDYRQDDETWWKIGKDQGYYIGNIEYDDSSNTHGITMAIKIVDHDGDFLGVMKVVVGIVGLIRDVENYAKRHETTRVMVITEEGKIIYRSGAFKFLEDFSGTELFKKMDRQGGYFITSTGNRERLYSYSHSKGYRDFKGLNWIVLISHDVQEVLLLSIALRQKTISTAFILIIAGGLITYLMSRSITIPIRMLISGIQKLGKGDLEHRVMIKTKDETGELAAAFNSMAKDLWNVTASRDELNKEIAERRKAVEELRGSEEQLQFIANHAPVLIAHCDRRQHYKFVNQRYAEYFGYRQADIIGKHPREVLGEDAYAHASPHIEGTLAGHTVKYELELPATSGGTQTLNVTYAPERDTSGQVVGFIAAITDITERKLAEKRFKRAQAQFMEAEKLGALGTLTAGIAHELNNPMMGMLNFSQYCLKHVHKTNKAFPVLEDMVRETKRCIEIVKNLLTFSQVGRGRIEEYKKIHCSVIFDRVISLLKYRVEKENISIERSGEGGIPEIVAKVSNLQQVFLNLIGNALDALSGVKDKSIKIKTFSEGDTICIEISDNGEGIEREKLTKIFDPFFTTKPLGKGTGLGLSVVRNIVDAHGGNINCKSTPGKGTTFKVCLPVEQDLSGTRVAVP